jgi:hypothetical protein
MVKVTDPEVITNMEADSTVTPEQKVVLLDPWWEAEYMGVAVGVLVTVILILIAVIIFIMYKNHVSNNYPGPEYCYQSPPASKPCPQGTIWEDKAFPASPRKLPPTPLEKHYRDTSMEYSSPLLNTSLRQQQEQQYAASHWGNIFTSPLPRTLPPERGSPVVSHYAATDLIGGRERLERNPAAQFL